MTHSQREGGTDLFSRIHDAAGNLTAVTFPDGTTRTFGYDARQLMTAHADPRGNRGVLTYGKSSQSRVSPPTTPGGEGDTHTVKGTLIS